MKNDWSKATKINGYIPSLVVSCSALTSVGIANGRTIPVAFVENDENNRIASTIDLHKQIKHGSCSTQWGITEDKKYVLLFLSFSLPTETSIVLFFDILKYGHVITHVIRMQCLYLMVGNEGSKLSENLDSPRVLIEIKNDDFLQEWNKIFKKEYTKYLKEKYNLSKKAAAEVFEKMTQEISIIEKLRLN